MARIALTWELGAGFGHIVPHLPFVRLLRRKGHEVVFILRDLARADWLGTQYGVSCFQAPVVPESAVRNRFEVAYTYAHVLHNTGFNDVHLLAGMLQGWRSLFETLRPDLVVFDHSPTALLAARAYDFRKIAAGPGFTIPPPVYPLPNLRPWVDVDPEKLRSEEDRVLDRANRVLGRFDTPIMERLYDLFSNVPKVVHGFKELDPYGERRDGKYLGAWAVPFSEESPWPSGPGKKIFAYLKPIPALDYLLTAISRSGLLAIVYIDGMNNALKQKYRSPTLTFVNKPQNMRKIAEQCDFAILNATLHTTCNLLASGKPALHLPIYLEQHLTALRVERLGVGLNAPSFRKEEIDSKLEQLIGSDSFREKAVAFAARYAGIHPDNQVRLYAEFIERTIALKR